MLRNTFFFLFILFLQSCSVYKVINKTNEDKKLQIGMKTYNVKNTQYYIDLIENVRNIHILNKSVEQNVGYNTVYYEIRVPSKHSLRLNKLLDIYMLSYKITGDSFSLYLDSGQPILILSDSLFVNNFKRVNLIPWFQYAIED